MGDAINNRHYQYLMSGIKASLGDRKIRVKQSLGVSEKADNVKIKEINEILKVCDNARVMVYPVGLHTNFLFEKTDLKYKNVVAFADTYQKNYMGFEVRVPVVESFQDVDKIVLSSYYHQQEIEEQLVELGLKEKIVKLYDKDDIVPFYEIPNIYAPDFAGVEEYSNISEKKVLFDKLDAIEEEWSEKSCFKVKLNIFPSVDEVKSVDKYKDINRKIAIVIQGQVIYAEDFTYNTIRLYKKIFKGSKVILSTWKDEDEKAEFGKIKSILDKDELVLNDKPSHPGILNVNYQIISSNAGFARAKELGIEYALKTRTDFRIYAEDSLAFLYVRTMQFPAKTSAKKRISILPPYSDIPYYIPDYLFFGNVDDLSQMWDAKELFDDKSEQLNPEMLVFIKYTKLLGVYIDSPQEHIKEYIDMLCDTFIITDFTTYKPVWKKYTYESLEQYQDRGNMLKATDWFIHQSI